MTSPADRTDSLISDFLAVAESHPAPSQDETEAGDYDWDSPSSFTPGELANLQNFAEQVCIEIAKSLSGQIHEEIKLQTDKPQQYYAEKIPLLQSESVNYCAVLSADGAQNCGLISAPAAQAVEWIAKVLGGSDDGAAEQEKEVSSLESALLQDILTSATKAFSNALQQVGGSKIGTGVEISAKAELPEANPVDEYILMSFRTGQEDQHPAISIILTSEVLSLAAGASGQKQGNESTETIQKKILANVEQAEVEVVVRLGTSNLTIREVMSLEEGDVLLLHKTIDEPAELIVQGKAIMTGYPVRCEEQYALKIAGPVTRTDGKRNDEINPKAPAPAPLSKKGQN